MKMTARLCLLMLIALCSSAANSQKQSNPAQPCYQALADDPRFSLVREKVALAGATDEMRRMTARIDRASREEGEALAAWRNARAACHKQELPYFATRDSEIDALAREHFASVQALITELQGGTMTYGEFSRRRIDLGEKARSRIEKVRQNVLPPKLPPPPGQYGK